MVFTSTSLILPALLAAGATIWAGVSQKKAVEDAGEKQLGLANIARADTLEQQKEVNEQSRKALSLRKKQFDYQKLVGREAMNKSHIKMLGDSLSYLSKSGMNMTNFMNSLYSAAPQRMG